MADSREPTIQPVAFLYGDYACPYSYLVDARLELLASEAGLTIAWRPLPTFDPESKAGWLGLSKDGSSLESCVEEVGRAAAQLGLPFRLPESPPSTRYALQAAEFARDCGPTEFSRFHRAVFRAVFSDGIDIGDPLVLADIADRAGIDTVALAAALEDSRYGNSLEEAEAEASRYSITSTPTVLIGKFKLIGAAPMEVMRSTLSRAMQST